MTDKSPPTSITRALRGAVANGLALAQVRLELLGIEAREAFHHLLAVLSWLFVAAVALALGVVFVSVLITVALWDSHRLLALTAFAVLFATLGGVAVWQVRRLLAEAALLFSASVAELQADRERLASLGTHD